MQLLQISNEIIQRALCAVSVTVSIRVIVCAQTATFYRTSITELENKVEISCAMPSRNEINEVTCTRYFNTPF